MNTTIMRQIILDIETTGININQVFPYYEGHNIIEIGAVEMINRRLTGNNFHIYLKPDQLIDPEAFIIHGIADEFLLDKPIFSDIANEFIEYIRGAELIIHNATFDVDFINYELKKIDFYISKIDTICRITDSLMIARKMFPGKRNSIDGLCSRYGINNTKRALHGALLDAQILANIYLRMTGGQIPIAFSMKDTLFSTKKKEINIQQRSRNQDNHLRVILATDEELINHESHLDLVYKKNRKCLWRMC